MFNIPNHITLQIVLGATLVWAVTLVLSLMYPEQRTSFTLMITCAAALVAVFFSLQGMNHLLHGRKDWGDRYRP